MSRSYKSKHRISREIGPMYAYENCRWSKNILNRKMRHEWQDQVEIELSYGGDDWVDDFPMMWDDYFEGYDARPFKVMRDVA